MKIIASNVSAQSRSAFTLIEVIIASAVSVLAMMVVCLLGIYCGRCFAALANYSGLDQEGQLALDKMSREIRQAHSVISVAPTSVSLVDKDHNTMVISYDQASRTLMGVSAGVTNVYLTDCDSLQFTNYQKTVISNTFDAYLPAYVSDTRLLQVTWTCSRSILGAKMNNESVQSAKIAIRNNN
jgi:prepilin-type N-terminal cleavage/methylation domain-containing protein